MSGKLFPLHLNEPAEDIPEHFSFSFKSLKRSATSITFVCLIISVTMLCFVALSAEKEHSSVSVATPCLSFVPEMYELKSKIRKKISLFQFVSGRLYHLSGKTEVEKIIIILISSLVSVFLMHEQLIIVQFWGRVTTEE